MDCAFYFKSVSKLLLIYISFFNFTVLSQTKDTVVLPEIEIKSTKISRLITGRKLQSIDSTQLDLFKNQTLADVLSSTTPIFIKNYGPGAISTTAFRGGNASQTAILWNGLNIQNSMLGQVDLSTISSNLFNSVNIEYGGSSALWGSGAIGGAIHLGNSLRFNQGVQTKLQFMASTIGAKSIGSDIYFSDSKFGFVLKAFGTQNKNTFSYYNKLMDTVLTQKHANYEHITALPEFSYKINNQQSLSAALWLSKGARRFPNQNSFSYNNIQQYDESNRLNVSWNFNSKYFTSQIKTAYFIEHLNYVDSIAAINSKSKMQTLILENDNFYSWYKNQQLNLGFNYTSNHVNTLNYESAKELNRLAAMLSNTGHYLNSKLQVNTTIRLEHTSTQLNPFTYNAGINYQLFKSFSLKLNGGSVYRLPTLNDLYWLPGGNKLLKPESGFTLDGTIEYQKTSGALDAVISVSAFHKTIGNWILWLPANGYSTPMNIQSVWSRGTETLWQFTYSNNDFKAQVKCITGYLRSTVKESNLEEDNTIGRQLIYTPRYTVNTILMMSFKTITLSFFHNYIGYRFTSSDNSTWLNPFHYSTYRMTYNYAFKKMSVGTFLNINNVMNSKYEVIANRPMPLRYFEIGMQLNYKQTKKK